MRQGIKKYLSALAMMVVAAVTIIGGSTIASAGSDYGDFAENLQTIPNPLSSQGAVFGVLKKILKN